MEPIIEGHLFYYERTKPSIYYSNGTKYYEALSDYGVKPIALIIGFYPNAYEKFMQDVPSTVAMAGVKYINISSSLLHTAISHKKPWIMHADKLVDYVYYANEIKSSTNIAKGRYFKTVSATKDYPNLFTEIINYIVDREQPAIDFIVENLGDEYKFLYDVLRDVVEIFIWHGDDKTGQLHNIVENIINVDYIQKIAYHANMYWKINNTMQTFEETLTSMLMSQHQKNKKEEKKETKQENKQKSNVNVKKR
jgi:hypothetical protein